MRVGGGWGGETLSFQNHHGPPGVRKDPEWLLAAGTASESARGSVSPSNDPASSELLAVNMSYSHSQG